MSQSSPRAPRRALRAALLVAPLLVTGLALVSSQEQTESASDIETFTFPESASGVRDPRSDQGKRDAISLRSAPVSSSGAYERTVPIDVPPGRLAMTPSLALAYSSAAARRESAVGAGWSIDPPRISRSTRRGFPRLEEVRGALRYDDRSATFEGPTGILVPAADGPKEATGSLFAPLREMSPVRYERILPAERREESPFDPPGGRPGAVRSKDPLRLLRTVPAGGLWVEHRPDGRRRYYGADLDGRRGQITNELGTHAWLLMMEEDPHGNHITYDYHHLADQDREKTTTPQREPVLASISWGGNRRQGLAHRFRATVRAEPRPGGEVDMLGGHTYLATRVREIQVGSTKEGAPPFWTYRLELTESEDTGRLLLSQVTRSAPGEADRITTFEYSANSTFTWAAAQPLPAQLGPVYSRKSSVSGFSPSMLSLEAAVSPADSRSAHRFIDFDGDGDTDVVYHPAGLGTTTSRILWPGSFLQSSLSSWTRLDTVPPPAYTEPLGGIRWPMPSMALADINADGRVDVIFRFVSQGTERVSAVFLNTGRGWELTTRYQFPDSFVLAVESSAPGGFDNPQGQSLTDMGRLVDLDGDGLLDLLTPGDWTPATGLHSPPKWHRNTGVVPDLLTRVSSSIGDWTEVSYVAPSAPDAAEVVESDLRPAGQMVVREVRRAAGPPAAPAGHSYPVETIELAYENYVRDVVESEPIGFEAITARFVNSSPFPGAWPGHGTPIASVTVRTEHDVTKTVPGVAIRYPRKGTTRRVLVESGSDRREIRTEHSAEMHGQSVRVRESARHTADCRADGGATECAWRASQVLERDEHGFPTVRREGPGDGTQVLDGPETARIESDHIHRVQSFWILGLESSRTVRGYREDEDGEPQSDAILAREETTYDPNGRAVRHRRPGLMSAEASAATGHPRNAEQRFEYDAYGLLTRSRDVGGPHPFDARFEYDEGSRIHLARRVLRATPYRGGDPQDPAELTEKYESDPRHGGITRRTDANGKVWTTSYDSHGRPLRERGPGGDLLAEHAYIDAVPLHSSSEIVTAEGAAFTRRTYLDSDGRVLSVIEGTAGSPPVRRRHVIYDGLGRPVATYRPAEVANLSDTAPAGNAPRTITTYDGLDRATAVRTPDGRVTTFEHLPRATRETLPAGNGRSRELDWRGAVVRETRLDEEGGSLAETVIRRDGLGRIIRITDADGLVRRLVRDAAGRVVLADLPHAAGAPPRAFRFDHDAAGRPVRVRTPAEEEIRIDRDELGRPIAIRGEGPQGKVSHLFEYDDETSGAKGRLWRRVDASGRWTHTYDPRGLPLKLTWEPAPFWRERVGELAALYRATYTYSRSGHLRGLKLGRASGAGGEDQTLSAYAFDRDGMGRPSRIRSLLPDGAVLVDQIRLDPSDRLSRLRCANGLRAVRTYDPLSDRLTRIAWSLEAGGGGPTAPPALDVAFSYDPNGNPLTETRTEAGVAVMTKTHQFDALDRLVSSIVQTGASAASLPCAYSPGGRVTAAHGESYVYGDPSIAQAVTAFTASGEEVRTLTYDAGGRLESDRHETEVGTIEQEVRHDALGHPLGVRTLRTGSGGQPDSEASTLVVSGSEGERILAHTVLDGGSRTETVVDFAGFAEIRPEAGVLLARLPIRGEVVCEEATSLDTGARLPGKSGFVHADPRGSVLAVSAPQGASPLVREAVDYDGWGASVPLGDRPPPGHRFLGEDPDPPSGWYQLGPRLYDPSLRRFAEPDPLLWLEPERALDETQELNLYAYAANNPVRLRDPSGLQAKEDEDEGTTPPDGAGEEGKEKKKDIAPVRWWKGLKKWGKENISDPVRAYRDEKLQDWIGGVRGTRRRQHSEQGVGGLEYYRDDDRDAARDLGDSLEKSAKAAKSVTDVKKAVTKAATEGAGAAAQEGAKWSWKWWKADQKQKKEEARSRGGE